MPTPRTAPRSLRTACLVVLVAITVAFAASGWRSIHKQWADFEYFYKAGAWLVHHGTMDPAIDRLPEGRIEHRGGIEWYLPFVSRLFTLIAWLPYPVAGALWLGLNVLAFLTTVRLLGRYVCGLPRVDWPVTQLLPVIFLGLAWHWEFRLNQINSLTLLLLVGSFVAWRKNRANLSGFTLGLAVLLKVTPVLVLGWFILKRQYRVVSVALLTVLIAGPLSDVAAFGPSYTIDNYRAWFQAAVVRGSSGAMIRDQREMDWRNQALGAVLSRWLHPTNYARHFDNDPRIRLDKPPATMNVLNLSRRTVARIVAAIVGLSVVGLLWLARRPADRMTPLELRLEWSLFLLAMLWFMPVMRRYHLIWALPAMSALAGAIHFAGMRSKWRTGALLCVAGVVAAQASLLLQAALDSNLAEAGGMLLLSVVFLAVAQITGLRRIAKHPDRDHP